MSGSAITPAGRSRPAPMRQVTQMFHDHDPLMRNGFAWKKAFSSAAIEGLNNKAPLWSPDDPKSAKV